MTGTGHPAAAPPCAPRVLTVKGALWVLNKPAGYAVHPAGDDAVPDLLSWAAGQPGAPAGLAPIHRLDRGTSGLVLLSADPGLRGELGRAFAAGQVHKQYRALVHGRTHPKGVIRRPLPDPRRRRPLAAVTRYRRLQELPGCTYLRVRPETGRKHQIRRHLAGLGHPVVGDPRHPPRRGQQLTAPPARLWLHCARLLLPEHNLDLRAPLAPDLRAHLATLAGSKRSTT